MKSIVEREDLVKQFPSWAGKVISALNATPLKFGDNGRSAHVAMNAPDGPVFWLNLDSWKGRVHVSMAWPRDLQGQAVTWRDVDYNSPEGDIYVGADRQPSAAAKDIARRFLPRARELWPKLLARIHATAQAVANASKVGCELCATWGTTLPKEAYNQTRFALHPKLKSVWKLEIQQSEVSMDIRYIPAAQAKEILALLAAYETAKDINP